MYMKVAECFSKFVLNYPEHISWIGQIIFLTYHVILETETIYMQLFLMYIYIYIYIYLIIVIFNVNPDYEHWF